MSDVRFEFGKNWADYAKKTDETELAGAIQGLTKLLPDDFDPYGKSFLDIGSGSGLHSVAASRLGFSPIVAVDYDENSVETTKRLADKFGARIDCRRDDILDTTLSGEFDVVYSWGVLHHTGDMRKAIENAASLVAKDGLLIIALYRKTPMCGVWKGIKRTYSASPSIVQKTMGAGYYGALLSARAVTGKLRGSYKEERGMNRYHDAIDWLGGYPYESAEPAEVPRMVGDRFSLLQSFNTEGAPGRGILGTGCSEYVFATGAGR